MAQLGRQAIGSFGRTAVVAAVFALGWDFASAQAESIEIKNLERPGAVLIANGGPTVTLATKVLVERKRGTDWIASPVLMWLIRSCAAGPVAESIDLPSGSTFEPVPWNGYTCSGQCVRSCRSNHYAGPGVFRFVVFRADRRERFTGAEFTLPAQNDGQKSR